MGKITNDRIELTISVNGSAAKNELGKLEKEATSLGKSYKELLLEKKKLNKTDADYGKTLSALNQKITQNKIAVDQNKVAQDQLRKSIGLTGLTMNQLNKEAAKLRVMKANLTPGTLAFKQVDTQLQSVNKRMAELKGSAKGGSGMFGKLADSFNKYQALAMGVVAGAAAAGLAIASMIQGNAKLADSLADVMKTTGMTEEEVKRLNSMFKNIDTRSSRQELRDLAVVAGKLGITGVTDIYNFVKAADQINVALSADLGGNAEAAINSLGKLTDLFGLKQSLGLEQSLLKTGSAINALGAASSASELYLVNFARRLGGAGKQADISLQNILGLGATLDQLGQTAEVSTTTLSKVFVSMFKDPGEYAKIAGMEVQDFSNLLKTDSNAALVKFLEGLNGNNAGLALMAKKMDGLGLAGARSVGVLATLASNTKMLKDQQALSNDEFNKGTSLTNEFNTKNTNLAATIDKLGKRFNSMFVNSGINKALQNITTSLYEWIKVPVDAALRSEQREVNRLVFELTKANTTEEQRQTVLTELNKINPKITAGLKAEKLETAQLVTNLRAYNEEMANRIVIANLEEDEQKSAAKQAKVLQTKLNMEVNLMDAMRKIDESIALNSELSMEERVNQIIAFQQKAIEARDARGESSQTWDNEAGIYYDKEKSALFGVEAIWKELQQQQIKYDDKLTQGADLSARIAQMKALLGLQTTLNTGGNFGGGEGSGSTGYVPEGDGKKSKAEKDAEKEQEKMEEYRKQVLLNAQSLINQENVAYEDRLRQAGIFNKKKEDMTAEDISIQEILLKQHLLNISKINDDAFSADVTKLQSDFELENSQREQAYKEQLKIIGDNEQEKAAFTAWYDKQTEDRTRKHLETLLKMLQEELPSADNFSLDLESSVLSDEAKDALLKKIEEVKLALANLGMPSAKPTEEPTIEIGIKTDIFGMSAEDWANMLTNLKNGKIELTEMLALAGAMSNAFSMINEIRSNSEERSLIEFEEHINSRKEMLDNLLKYNRISQERYNKRVSALDEELDAKKRKIAHDQAVRNKETAIFQAFINTAMGVTSALATPPPWLGIALAILIGGMGALQIAAIASEPIPQAYSGKYDVIGQQDGKKYSGPVIDSPSTGLINSPAILVGEKPELIVDPATTKNLMVNYPHVIQAIQNARVPQFASGDYSNIDRGEARDSQKQIATILAAQTLTMDRLNRNLENGIQAKLLANDEYIRTHKDVDSRYSKLSSKANSSL
ncbi:MAG: phage tail tape measure protein [Bacteroidales bacterium]|nr:phage tail tape measure protein [Bacteroidales bacterium]